jgi:hypothetical protein
MKNLMIMLFVILAALSLTTMEVQASEYNTMYNSDGSLNDPVPDDGYTAKQNHSIVVMVIILIFFVWCGMGSGIPFFQLLSCIVALLMGLYFVFA